MPEEEIASPVAETKGTRQPPKRLGVPGRLTSWEQRFHDLKAFKKAHGHCNVPDLYPPNPALGRWVATTRQRKKHGKLSAERCRRLDALAFCWVLRPPVPIVWKQRINELKAFKKAHGHCNVPDLYPPNPALGYWVATTRQRKKHGKLSADKIRTLDALGFCWLRHAASVPWEQRVNDLKAFKEHHGHCNVPNPYPPNPALGHWVANVRNAKKRGRLAVDKIRTLDALAFCWVLRPPVPIVWEQRINELEAFKKAHGHCHVPDRYPPNPALGHWVATTRQRKKHGKLTADEIRTLDALGLCWVRETVWKQRVHDLKAFKEEHGHCNVPMRYPPNPALGQWVIDLRRRKKRGELAEDKISILDALGFSWLQKQHPAQVPWEQRVNDLKAFKDHYGHCNVSGADRENLALGRWVNNVRQRKKHGKLTADKIRTLDALGFCWLQIRHAAPVPWEQRVNDLKAFKEHYGHCNVSGADRENLALGRWVRNVRQRKKRGKLTADEIRTLDALGFCWVR